MVYAKRPFAGSAAVLAYLSRYTHQVAISNSRLLTLDERGVTFKWKDYRNKGGRRDNLARARELLHVVPVADVEANGPDAEGCAVQPTFVCPHCGAAMFIIETLARAQPIRAPPQLKAPP